MFAVIEDGSHQYRVQAGDTLSVDLRDSAKPGDAIRFDRVLLASAEVGSTIGKPLIEGAVVDAEVVEHYKDKKLEIGKFRRRKNYRRHTGHRQKYTLVKITSITVPGLG